jgi:hypothetical protein
MLRLEDITKDAAVNGIESGQIVRIVTTGPVGENALTVYYRTADGRVKEQMLFRSSEAFLSLAEAGRPWAFDAPGEEFKLAAEACWIVLTYLFDPMMVVHTSNVEPLPHQITAVYESMLPRQPLRFVLADDPGAGKTIMAGLLIRELRMRADAERVLIVAPRSLVEQWQDEMYEKFGLTFTIFSHDLAEQSSGGNPFDDLAGRSGRGRASDVWIFSGCSGETGDIPGSERDERPFNGGYTVDQLSMSDEHRAVVVA